MVPWICSPHEEKPVCAQQTSDGPITRCVEPSLFWHKMVLVENLRVDLSRNNPHYTQMFCPDMWLSMRASSLLCSTHTYLPCFRIHTMYVSCTEYLSFSILNLSLLHIYRGIKYSLLNIVAQPLSSTSNSWERSFCFILSIKLGHYYLLTLIKRCTSSSEISFDLISCRKKIKLKRNKAPGTGEQQNKRLWHWQWNRAWSKSW